MATMAGFEFEARVSAIIHGLGYEAVQEPSRLYHRGFWRASLDSLARRNVPRPDILISNAGKSVVLEIKTGNVLLGGVMQVVSSADAFDAAGVLCVPDDDFRDIPGSVRRYAKHSDVSICSLSGLGDVLTSLLGPVDDKIT